MAGLIFKHGGLNTRKFYDIMGRQWDVCFYGQRYDANVSENDDLPKWWVQDDSSRKVVI